MLKTKSRDYPQAKAVKINSKICAVVTIGGERCYTYTAARTLLRCSDSQFQSYAEDGAFEVRTDCLYRDTASKLTKARVYPIASVDRFKPQLTQSRQVKAAKARNRKQDKERRRQAPELVNGCWTDQRGRVWEADFVSDHDLRALNSWHAKGCSYLNGRKLHRQTKYFRIPGQRNRSLKITLQSESKAITAERYPDSQKQAEQPKEIDDVPMPLQELAVLKGVSLTLLRNLTNKQSRHPAFGGKPMPFVKEAHRWARRGTVITRIVVKARGSTVDKYLTWRDRKATPVEWLGRELSAGPKWRADVIAAAANAGFSVSPIQCAARELGVRSQRSNNDAHRSVTGTFAKGSGRTCAQWSLPDHIAAKYGDTGQQPAAEVEKIAADARAKSDPADKIMDNAARERAYLSPRDLADEFGVPFDALRMRLNRFRGQNHKGWIENPNRGSREPEFLYQVKAIQMIVHELQPKRP